MRRNSVLVVAVLITTTTLLLGCGGARNPGTMMLPGVSQLHWSPVDRIPAEIEQELSTSLTELGLQLLVPATPALNHSERLVAWVSTWRYAPSQAVQADFGINYSEYRVFSLSTSSNRLTKAQGATKISICGTTGYLLRGTSQTPEGFVDWVSISWKEPNHPAVGAQFYTAWMDEASVLRWLETWQWLPHPGGTPASGS